MHLPSVSPQLYVDASMQSDSVIRDAITSGMHTAIIPVGSTEQHGPHLPVSTDSDIALEVSRLISKKNGYLLMPVIPYGVSYEHAPLFQTSIRPFVLYAIILDVCASLHTCGICNVIIINAHHGNIDALDKLCTSSHQAQIAYLQDNIQQQTDAQKEQKIPPPYNLPKIHLFHYWRYMDAKLGHAGFTETSMMLTISPNTVIMKRAIKGLITDHMSDDELKRVSAFALKSFPEATGNGIWGDPRGASAQVGKSLLEEAASNIAKICIEKCKGS